MDADYPNKGSILHAESHGALLETFVFSEVLKLMTASEMRLNPHHFRDQQMREVDIVLERDDGISRSSVGGGSIYRPSLTITAATSLPGSFVQR